jgi:hypothetical protein
MNDNKKLRNELKMSIYDLKQKITRMRLDYETERARTEGIIWAYEKVIDSLEPDTSKEDERNE